MKNLLVVILLIFFHSDFWSQTDSLNQFVQPGVSADSIVVDSLTTDLKLISSDSDSSQSSISKMDEPPGSVPESKKEAQKKNTGNTSIEKSFPTIEAVRNINFYTLLNIFILLLLGVGIVKVVDVLPIGKNFFYYSQVKIFLKIIIWLLVFYLILNLLIEETNNVIIYIIVAITIIFSLSALAFFKNIVGGFYISLNLPFQVGDYIRINAFEGEVLKSNWRETSLKNSEAGIILIPNSYFLIYPLENINKGLTEQLISLDLYVSAEIKPEDAKMVIYEAALSSPFSYLHKEPKVFFVEYDLINRLNKYELQVYVKEGKYENNLIDSINTAVSKYLTIK